MREIKFRAWFKREKRWLRNDEYKITSDGKASTFGVFPSSIDIILMQFTGLHDKNKKEIYENDRVSGVDINPEYGEYYFKGIIQWDDEKCAFSIKEENGKTRYMNEFITIEVIGNIYENPEPLKEGKS